MKLKNATAVTAIAAAGVLMAATAAHATTTVSVGGSTSPAGAVAVTGTSVGTISFSTNFGVPTACSTSTATGAINRGASAVAGTTVGAISNLSFSSCATFLNWAMVLGKRAGSPTWPIVATATPVKGARYMSVELRGVQIRMLSPGSAPYACGVDATGNVPARIDTVTDQLQIIPTAGAYPLLLDALNSSGASPNTSSSSCGGEYIDGDLWQLSGTFQLNQDFAIS